MASGAVTGEGEYAAGQASAVHAELAWLHASKSPGTDHVLAHVCLAKNREFLQHTRATTASTERAVQRVPTEARRDE